MEERESKARDSGRQEDTVPIYKAVGDELVKVGEIQRGDAIEDARRDEPDVVDVKAIYILDEDPVALEGEEVRTAEFNLEEELRKLEEMANRAARRGRGRCAGAGKSGKRLRA